MGNTWRRGSVIPDDVVALVEPRQQDVSEKDRPDAVGLLNAGITVFREVTTAFFPNADLIVGESICALTCGEGDSEAGAAAAEAHSTMSTTQQ